MGGSEELDIDTNRVAIPRPVSRSRAVCLVSGGMDSCVTAAIAHAENDELAFLHVSYGQRTADRERKSFEAIADFYHVELRLVISFAHLTQIGGSSLTDKNIPVIPANLAGGGIPSSYVPFRNANFLAAATSWAEVLQAGNIYIGAVAEDSSGYPDCRPEFYSAFQEVINRGTKPETEITIRTPVIGMKKSEIVLKGLQMGAPLGLTWSCYAESELACGKCDSCALRLRAFLAAGALDPIPYMLDSSSSAY